MALPVKPEPSPALQAEALRIYLETTASLDQIAAVLGMHRRTLARRVELWRWPPRPGLRRRAPYAAAPGAAPEAAPDDEPVWSAPAEAGLDPQSRRLERLVARRIDLLEAEASVGRDPDPERTDRRLIQLGRLLTLLRKDRGPDGEPDDTHPPARSVAELRDELFRHLERLRQQARAQKLSGRAHRGGMPGPAAPLADPEPAPGPDPA